MVVIRGEGGSGWSSRLRSSRELKVDVRPRLPGSSVVSCFQGGGHWPGAWRAATAAVSFCGQDLASNITFPTIISTPPNIISLRCYFYQKLESLCNPFIFYATASTLLPRCLSRILSVYFIIAKKWVIAALVKACDEYEKKDRPIPQHHTQMQTLCP